MKIERTTKPPTLFKDVEYGDCFEYLHSLYIKTYPIQGMRVGVDGRNVQMDENTHDYNCVRLSDGLLFSMHETDKVETSLARVVE